MENVATSIRINAAANALLTQLAARTGKSKAEIVEQALREWEERTFWAGVQSAFTAPEPEQLRVERELWERTVADGLQLRRTAKRTRRKST